MISTFLTFPVLILAFFLPYMEKLSTSPLQ